MAVYTTKPATVGTTANPGGSLIGSTGTKFFMHVWAIDHEYWSPTAEVTGDGHADPIIINNGYIYGRFILTGAMLDDDSSQLAIGIRNLIQTNNAGTGNLAFNLPALTSVVLRFSSRQEVTVTLIVERIRAQWRKTGVYVPVSMICRMTNTGINAATIES